MAKRKAGGNRKRGGATPQPPAPAPTAPSSPSYELQYNPTIESQLNQPYQDIIAAQATNMLPAIGQNWQGLQDYANFYGGAGAEMFGGFMGGAEAERGLTRDFGAQAGGTLGNYGQLMDPNLQIQQQIAQQIQDIQAGKADFDPFLTQQFGDQERVLREQLRRQLGPDYETSSAGIEALSKFNQNKTTTLGSAQFQRLNELVNMQQGGIQNLSNQSNSFANTYGNERGQQFNQADTMGSRYGQYANDMYAQAMGLRNQQQQGAANMIANTQATQNMFANVPKTMGQFGEAMTGQGAQASQATAPYQRDRFAQLQNQQSTPNSGQMWGGMMAQSGNRWIGVGNQMMSTGGQMSNAGGV